MSKTKAKLGYSYGGMWGSIEPIPAEDIGQIDVNDEEYCPNDYYLCAPATEARPFIKRAKLIAGLVPGGCTAEEIATQEEFINRCDEYLATLPEEEKDGTEV